MNLPSIEYYHFMKRKADWIFYLVEKAREYNTMKVEYTRKKGMLP
jgi:hypothetical protein